jgi:tRNA(fMet)-specific endonuclease VapC
VSATPSVPTIDRALLDTDILSEIMRGRNPKVAAASASYLAVFGRYTISTLTVVEVVKGFHRRGHEARIQQFLTALSSIELLTLDASSAELAGRMIGDPERTGQPIGRVDPMIAGIAVRFDLTLVTGNEAHYRRFQALGYPLKLENWRT